MFDNIGWGEVLLLIIVGIIVIGPEKLPGVIVDVRAAIFAARRAINNAKAELNSDFGDEFDEFRQPLNTVSQYAAMGPRRAIAKAFFDEDESYLDQFDPEKMMQDDPAQPQAAKDSTQRATPAPPRGESHSMSAKPDTQKPDDKGDYSTGGGFSWADIT